MLGIHEWAVTVSVHNSKKPASLFFLVLFVSSFSAVVLSDTIIESEEDI